MARRSVGDDLVRRSARRIPLARAGCTATPRRHEGERGQGQDRRAHDATSQPGRSWESPARLGGAAAVPQVPERSPRVRRRAVASTPGMGAAVPRADQRVVCASGRGCGRGRCQDRPELAQDAGGGAPDRQPIEVVRPVAQRPIADRALDHGDRRVGQEAGDGRLDDPGHLDGDGARRGGRSARATTGVTSKSLTGIHIRSSRPTIRTPAATASRPTSSFASRKAVAAASASSGSALPPGKLTSPEWWPSPVVRSIRTMRASPPASG